MNCSLCGQELVLADAGCGTSDAPLCDGCHRARRRKSVFDETWKHHANTTAITFVGEEMIGSSDVEHQTILASFHGRRGDRDVERRERARLASAAPELIRVLAMILPHASREVWRLAVPALEKAGIAVECRCPGRVKTGAVTILALLHDRNCLQRFT